MREDYKNTIGLDIGIGSCGAAVCNDERVIYMGTHVFNPASEAKNARLARSARRNLKRKSWRKKQLIQAFIDFGILEGNLNEIQSGNYLCFETNTAEIPRPVDRTVYHLRNRALNEHVNERELLLCLYNILHARGHFLMETIDFSKDSISYEDYRNLFYETLDPYVSIPYESRDQFETEILKSVFAGHLKAKDINSRCDHFKGVLNNDTDLTGVKQFLLLISGYSAKTDLISPSIGYDKAKCTISDLKQNDNLPDFLVHSVELYDLSCIAGILADKQYLCEAAVEKMDRYDEVVQKYGRNSDEFKELEKEISGKSANGKHVRSVRNLENSFPNGMYVKEATAILRKQQEYDTRITDDFIEVCADIISARIPYYIGPLSEQAKNAWLTKNGTFKYSYAYSMKHGNPVNEPLSIETWKKRMISHCTYLPEEEALPKGSLCAEVFSIVNEMNILEAIDENGDRYYLSENDKIRVFDSLFMQGKPVRYSDVAQLLNLRSFGTRKAKDSKGVFKNSLTLYPVIAGVLPEFRLNSVKDILDHKEDEKIDRIESIILAVNLYDEEKTKRDYFINEMYMDETSAVRLSKLKSASFYSFSRKFIMSQPMNPQGNSLMELLLEDNTPAFVNEQMTRITNAVGADGVYMDFSSNKYEQKLRENGNRLDISLLLDDGKPVIPVSRPVLRGLNEALKMYMEMVRVYGIPKRVVVETARDLRDHTEEKQQTACHFDTMKKLHEYLFNQLKEHKAYKDAGHLEDWNTVEQYVLKNRTKIELYIRQNGMDLLTGEPIALNHLERYEVDHILPRGFGDDSMDDKMLISKLANAKKGDRLPLQFIESGETVGDLVITEGAFIQRVEMLYDMKLISENKRKRLLLVTDQDLDGFINQNLVDTRYIIREFMSILRAYNKVNGYTTHIVSLRAAYTKLYRNAFGMGKVRDYGDQHHAHDAALLVVADKTLSHYYPHYDEHKVTGNKSSLNTYQNFIRSMLSDDEKDKKDLITFVRKAFFYAYGKNYNSPGSMIDQIRKTVPFFSTKTEKNYKGQFFKANSLKNEEYKDTDVLSILGVNNEKQVFSGVECAAVDFYKYPTKKGKREHLAVHIPKVIIDSCGNIDQKKYIDLIRKHYKADELIDENGNLRTEFFRFRAFRNDIIYDTQNNCPFLFNIGSVVNKKIEVKYINVFSFDDIYDRGKAIAQDLIRKFDLKTRNNQEGKDFSDIGIHVYVDYVARNYWTIDPKDKKVENAIKMVEKERNIYDLSNHLSFIGNLINRPLTPPTITGQNATTAKNRLIAQNPDAEYVKLKYNILGLRFKDNYGGKLIIESPQAISGSYSKIRKEKFSWKLCKDEIE